MTKKAFVAKVMSIRKRYKQSGALVRALERAGFEYVGAGAFKKVYTLPGADRVVKVSFPGSELWGDDSQVGGAKKCYRKLSPEAKKGFLPLDYEDNLIQIQALVTVCRRIESGNTWQGCTAMQYWDGGPDNHTHIGRRKVVFDYDQRCYEKYNRRDK